MNIRNSPSVGSFERNLKTFYFAADYKILAEPIVLTVTLNYVTVLRLSSVCLSVTLCIVAKRCEQKLPLTAYRKSYMRNRLAPK